MKSQSYMTRALRARDPRFRTILGKLGYDRRDLVAATADETPEPPTDDLITELRQQYHDAVGKRPFHGWDAETLQAKIAEAKAAN
ncbi:MAG: hypothetical protein QHC90_26015 [Shinella sp.]|jgi:hypothetical protein|nr:hypothetical protein [Shinella sp.]